MKPASWRSLVPAALVAVAGLSAQAPSVDDAILRDPPREAWVTYGRDYAETHHSPLDRLTPANVGGLTLAWSTEVGSQGKVEATPLVWDGLLYGTSAWSVVFALDARTGALAWKWDPALVRGGRAAGGPVFCCGPVNRGVALYKGRVYAGLLDGRLVALDAKTGAVAWSAQTTPPGSDYSITGAPRIVKGRVIIGNAGGEFGVRGYLSAYDAETGRRAWRWYAVPGNPADGLEDRSMELAAGTWRGEWWKYGGGGTPWDGMAYDPDLDLLYVGTGNGSPWSRDHRSAGAGDNLFLSSIVALRPDTGEYVWHYQTTPGDDWDYTAAQPMVLADLAIEGRTRKVLMQAPKNGFFYVIDRETGAFISAAAFVRTTWATHVDPRSGRPVETPQARYGRSGARLSPSPFGAHTWPPMAYHPATGLVYFPGQETSAAYQTAETFTFTPGQWNTGMQPAAPASSAAPGTPATTATAPVAAPPSDPSPPGSPRTFLTAWDPVAQQQRWRIALQPGGGALSTAGGLLFVGDNEGRLLALDPATGRTLWSHDVLPGVATPITYEIDGTQHVSILAGAGKGRVFTFALAGGS